MRPPKRMQRKNLQLIDIDFFYFFLDMPIFRPLFLKEAI